MRLNMSWRHRAYFHAQIISHACFWRLSSWCCTAWLRWSSRIRPAEVSCEPPIARSHRTISSLYLSVTHTSFCTSMICFKCKCCVLYNKVKNRKKCNLNIGFLVCAMLIHGLCFNSTLDVAEKHDFFFVHQRKHRREATEPGCDARLQGRSMGSQALSSANVAV